jgi:hypothetical protein
VSSIIATNDSRLNNLDAAMSSRSPASTALTNATWTDVRAVKLDSIGASVINSIQRGQVDVIASADVTITAVNLTKSAVIVNSNHDALSFSYAVNTTVVFLNSTTLRFQNGGEMCRVAWEVIEWV